MAVAFELTYQGPGATLGKYYQLLERLGVAPEGPHPARACLFHWIALTPGGQGFRVTDVWTSRDEFLDFAKYKLEPISKDLGMPAPTGPPEPPHIELANYLTAGI